MAYAARYPQHVESIVLLAPGGILHQIPDGYKSLFFRYPSLCSSESLRRLVAKAQGIESASPRNELILRKEAVTPHDEADYMKDREPWHKENLVLPAVVQW